MNSVCLPVPNSLPDYTTDNVENSFIIPDEKGQSFIEFILLLFVILSLSIILTRGVNNGMAERWTQLIRTITGHELRTPPEVELP